MNSSSNSNGTARLSSSQRLTRSLSATADPLATPAALNRLLTFTNARLIQPDLVNISQSRSLSTASLETSFSSSLNPSSLPSMMFSMSDIPSSVSTTNTTTFATTPAHISASQSVSNRPVYNTIAQSLSLQYPLMNSTTPMLLNEAPAISSFHHTPTPLPLQTIRLPLACRSLTPNLSYRHHLNLCNIVCPSCNALHWLQEHSSTSTNTNPMFRTCCAQGKVSLPPLNDAPIALYELLTNQTSDCISGSVHFC